MVNIFKSIKLMKYSTNFLSYLFLYIVFTALGVYLMLTTEYTALSCAFLMLGPCMLSNIFVNLSEHESVSYSKLGQTVRKTIPNIIMFVSSVFTYVALYTIISLRFDEESIYYSIYSEGEGVKLFLYGFWIVFLAVILYPILSSNLIKGLRITIICYAIIMILSLPLFKALGENIHYEDIILTHHDVAFFGNIAMLIAYLVAFIWKPFSTSYEPTRTRKSIAKYIFAIGIIATIVIIATNLFKNKTMPSVDGIYDYSHLRDEYAKLAYKNPNPKSIKCNSPQGSFDLEIKEYYYNPDTYDAYCVLKITLNEFSTMEIELLEDYSGIRIHETDKSRYAYVDYAVEDEIYLELDHEITTNCNSIMDMEYKTTSATPNVAEVKLLINAIPESNSVPENGTFGLICGDFVVALPTNNDHDTYKSDENEILVSPVSMVHQESLPATDITLKMKSGKDIVIMSNGVLADGVEKHQNNFITKYIFYNTINTEKIEDVIFENNGDAYEPDYHSTFALEENSHMRKTVYYEKTDNKNINRAIISFEWLQEPDDKYMDYILLTYGANVRIRKLDISQLATNSINNKLNGRGINMAGNKIDKNRYTLYRISDSMNSINIFNTFFEDTSSEKYTNHTVSIRFDYYCDDNEFLSVNCVYYHMLTNKQIDTIDELDLVLKSSKCGRVGRAFMAN
ncbi:MAG: hypothetical protein J6L69_08940 [Lachnospiraceae bacterium]|nr:hypothetical protein [Lachnospiraceae bacterium]